MQSENVQRKLIGEKYRVHLDECLGQGSYGAVYKAYLHNQQESGDDMEIEQEVFAVKQVDISTQKLQQLPKEEKEQLVNELLTEIAILQKVKSPFICEMMDCSRSMNNMYFVLRYCNQGDLGTLIYKQYGGKGLPEELALKLFSQIVEGYKELHKHGIIHRDIKPANILLNNGNAMLADFGFGKITMMNPDTKQELTVKGTPFYRAPQLLIEPKPNQRLTVKATNKCDIWSCGVMLFEMLHGKKPWMAQTFQDLQQRIFQYDVIVKNPRISSETKQLIIQMLKKQEEDRISWEELFNHPLILKHGPSGQQQQ